MTGPELRSSCAARCVGLAAIFLIASTQGLHLANASGDTRTLSLHHVHTKENLTITYKKNGQYDEAAMKKINWIMRDWRKNQDIKMDPQEIDLLWEVYRDVGATQPIYIICGFRSSDTNAMLRRRSKGVARFSQHMIGKAIDFYIPGVPLDKLRATAMRLQGGGVGYYPASGSPFVHLDIGNVRAWPRMTREQLVKLFPNGRTVHLPSDGNPLPGYQLALADVERGNRRSAAQPKQRSLVASLFTAAPDVEETGDNESMTPSAAARGTTTKPAAPAATVVASNDAAPITDAPLPRRRPTYQIASAESRPAPAPAPRLTAPINIASLTPNQIIGMRGYWQGVPEAPKARAASASSDSLLSARRLLASSMTAAAGQDHTATVGPFAVADRVPPEVALAYATQSNVQAPSASAAPMGETVGRAPPAMVTTKGTASVAIKPAKAAPRSNPAKTADRMNDPWLRGVVLASSIHRAMTVTKFGDPDYSTLAPYLHKPDSTVVMTFSHDPHLGMVTDSFSGSAIVFQATVTFRESRTASLR